MVIKWKRRRWYTLELSTTCQTGQSQGHLRETHLAQEFCRSILLIIISNSQQLSRWQCGLRRVFVKQWNSESVTLSGLSLYNFYNGTKKRNLPAKRRIFFLSRLVCVLLLLKGIDPEAQMPDRLNGQGKCQWSDKRICQDLLLCSI